MYHRNTHLEKVHRSKVSRYVFLDTLMFSIYIYCVVKSHHTLHFLTGFMGDPSGHPQSSENSGMLDIGPFTLKLEGEYLPFRTCKIH